jgi:hypothetical protein
VVSYPDKDGKSIGVNSFFEPFYLRFGYNTTSEIFQTNRYYEPIDQRQSTHLCGEEKDCYVHAEKEEDRQAKGRVSEERRRTKRKQKPEQTKRSRRTSSPKKRRRRPKKTRKEL